MDITDINKQGLIEASVIPTYGLLIRRENRYCLAGVLMLSLTEQSKRL